MKKIMKNSFVPCILVALVGMVMMTGCEEKFKWDLPLSLSQRAINLDSGAGYTYVLVYSTGDWTLSLTDPNVTWATVDRVRGSGNGEFVFSYSDNFDYERSVGVVLTSGSLRDTVVFTQAGRRTSPTYTLSLDSVELLRSPETISIPVSSTNILYDFSIFNVLITYYDEDGNMLEIVSVDTKAGNDGDVLVNWIHNVRLTADAFIFDVTLNTLSYMRKADVTVSFSNGSYSFDSGVTVSQTTGGPVFVLDSMEGEYDYLSRSVIVSAVSNNISSYADKVVFDITYSGGSSGDWIQNPSISESGLSFSLAENGSGVTRSGVIAFSYTDSIGNSASGTYSVTQQAE